MPANLESVNGFSSVKDSSKIPTTHFWKGSYLVASNDNKVANATFVAPMKRSVRSVFSILILTAFAATLTCQVLIRQGGGGRGAFGFEFGFRSVEQMQKSVMVKPAEPVFNSTLLNYAAIDISEPQTRKNIEQLLDGNFASLGRYRTFDALRRFSTHDLRASSSKGFSVMLKSPEFYRYWLEFRRLLNNWSRGLRYEPEVMDSLVEFVKDPIDRAIGFFEGSNKRYGSCAVVGNSGILLQQEYGEMIDGHDVVIRLNNARIERYEKNVGSKTTISFVNSNILYLCARRPGCFCHPYGANVPLVVYMCQPVHFMDYTICNSSHKAPLIITDPRFDVLCKRIVKYYSLKRFAAETGKSLDEWSSVHDGPAFHYSSGMQAIMLAVGTCDRVSVFGFGKSASAKHHYHTNQKAELHLHDYEAEYEFYNDLVNNPKAIPFISDDFKFPPVVIYQ